MPDDRFKNITKQDLVGEYWRLRSQIDRPLKMKDFDEHSDLPVSRIKRYYGTFNRFKELLGEEKYARKDITPEMIIRCAQELNSKYGKLTSTIMRQEGYSQIVVDHHFGSFSDLMKRAGLQQTAIGETRMKKDEDLYQVLQDIEQRFGYVNTTLVHNHSSIPHATFINRFGAFGNACIQAGVLHRGQDSVKNENGIAMRFLQAVSTYLNGAMFHTEIVLDEMRIPEERVHYRLDAYFPDYRLIVEYHGEYHFSEFNWVHDEDSFRKTQLNDQRRREMAREAGFLLLEIPHHIMIENAETFISDHVPLWS